MMKSRFHELAADELAEAVAHYEVIHEGLGDRLLIELRAAVAHIERYPGGSPEIERGMRRKILAKFPYQVFYSADAKGVVILCVAHESRRPGIWRGRTP